MRKAEKLFQLTNLLRSKRVLTAEELAQSLNVSVRSVYRYIDDLSLSGIPIYGTKGLGYQLHENFELPPLTLTPAELEALILGVKMIGVWTSDNVTEASKTLLDKIQAVLPESKQGEALDRIHVSAREDREQERGHWECLHQASKDGQALQIHYCDEEGNVSTRSLMPLGVVYWGGKWTLGAWCFLREDYRSFRVDRIRSLNMLENTPDMSEGISFKTYLASIKDYCN